VTSTAHTKSTHPDNAGLGLSEEFGVRAHVQNCAGCGELGSSGRNRPVVEIEQVIHAAECLDIQGASATEAMSRAATTLGGTLAVIPSDATERLRGRALFMLGWHYRNNGRMTEAREANLRARRSFELIHDEKQTARTYIAESTIEAFSGAIKPALDAAEKAMKIYSEHGDDRGMRHARAAKGGALLCGGRADEAALIYRELVAASENDDDLRPHWIYNLALSLAFSGETETADELAAEALRSPAFAKDRTASLRGRALWAWAEASRGNFAEAIERYEELLLEARAEGLFWDEIAFTCTLSTLHSLAGRQERAAALARLVVEFVTRENLGLWTVPSVVALREAIQNGSASLHDEVNRLREELPEVLGRCPVPFSKVAAAAERRSRT
jgi:tetratricopeptide (TPR) repeat protein